MKLLEMTNTTSEMKNSLHGLSRLNTVDQGTQRYSNVKAIRTKI